MHNIKYTIHIFNIYIYIYIYIPLFILYNKGLNNILHTVNVYNCYSYINIIYLTNNHSAIMITPVYSKHVQYVF